MSFHAMAWASKQVTGKSMSKFVLLMLADRANKEGLCYPSTKTLAKDCETSRDTVMRHCKKLEEMGLIKIIHRVEDSVKLSNHYQLIMDVSNEQVVADCDYGSSRLRLGGSSTLRHKPISSSNQSFNQENIKEDLKLKMNEFKEKYSRDLLNSFYSYWTEENKKGKMRMQSQEFFDVSRRLATFKKNEKSFSNNSYGKNETKAPIATEVKGFM